MKFGLFMMPLHHPTENPTLAFQRDLQLIEYVEDLGFDEIWVGEHHTGGWGDHPLTRHLHQRRGAADETDPHRHRGGQPAVPASVRRGGADGLPRPSHLRPHYVGSRPRRPAVGREAVRP